MVGGSGGGTDEDDEEVVEEETGRLYKAVAYAEGGGFGGSLE